ncbi:MAG: pilus assembly protein [Tardiphaga sp.]|nr:pilus assembly protein [Tardiphaga sp.]
MVLSFAGDIRGNVAIIFAVAALPIMGCMGMTVDYSLINDQRAKLQLALDSALLAGVQEASNASEIAKANSMFAGNLDTKWAATTTATFSVAGSQLVGTASATMTTKFMGMMGFPTVNVSVAGAAAATASSAKACIILVANPASNTLVVNSGASISGSGCEIHVDSSNGTAATINTNNSLNVAKVCIKGGATQNSGNNAAVSTGCAAVSNPFVGTLPAVSPSACNYNNQSYNGGSVTLSPGRYCGSTAFNGGGTLTFSPGLYVIQNGSMTFNSGWNVTGSGVTFYLVNQNATLTFNSGVNAVFSAPTSGTYANILVYEPDGLSQSNLPINGSTTINMQGLLYLPSRQVAINSVSSVTALQTVMVFSTLTMNGMNWSISPGALAPNSGTTTVSGARLVR